MSDPHAALAELQPAVKINLNTASESELTQLHGVGATLARRIVEYRLAHGHFTHVDQLTQVHGVGAAKLSKLKGVLSVE